MKLQKSYRPPTSMLAACFVALFTTHCASDRADRKKLDDDTVSMSAKSIGVVEKKADNPANILTIQECPDSETYFNSALESNTLTVGLSWQVSATQRKIEKARFSTTYRCIPR